MNDEPREHTIDPERQQRSNVRAEHVIAAYLAEHSDEMLKQKVDSGLITMTEAYQLLKQLTRDAKTKLQPSTLMRYALDYECYQARETQQPVTVAMFDIDDFKLINSELTHVVADEILERVADIISSGVRLSDDVLPGDEDIVFRYGGEEFVVIFSGTSQEQARIAADRIRDRIRAEFVGTRPDNKPITVSVGLAEYQAAASQDWKGLLRHADEQMLAAKQHGKDCVFPEVPKQTTA